MRRVAGQASLREQYRTAIRQAMSARLRTHRATADARGYVTREQMEAMDRAFVDAVSAAGDQYAAAMIERHAHPAYAPRRKRRQGGGNVA